MSKRNNKMIRKTTLKRFRAKTRQRPKRTAAESLLNGKGNDIEKKIGNQFIKNQKILMKI